MRLRPNKLERKLTLRMMQVQILGLLLFFGVCVFPLIIYPVYSEIGQSETLDSRVAGDFAESLQWDGDTIFIRPIEELTRLVEAHPTIWFHAQTEAGATATIGVIPAIYREIANQSWSFEAFDTRRLNGQLGAAGLRTEASPVGPVRVLTGNGPVVVTASILGAILGAMVLGIAVTVVIVSALVIPLVIRKEMRGLKAAAQQAQAINVDARDTRLSLENVPDEVKPLVQSVNDALARLDRSHAERERFLADSAHELRTPIAILQTRIEAEAPFSAQTQLLVDVARLSSLADQLLDLQRMDLTGARFEKVDLNEVAREVVGDLAPLAGAAGYELALALPTDSVWVQGDLGGLARALTNIVQNAIAYGGRRGEILVQVHRSGTLSVSDDGPGIREGERGKVIEPFYRVSHTGRGTGLGLNLVDLIVRRHHGRLSVGESISGGARFVINLPTV